MPIVCVVTMNYRRHDERDGARRERLAGCRSLDDARHDRENEEAQDVIDYGRAQNDASEAGPRRIGILQDTRRDANARRGDGRQRAIEIERQQHGMK